MPMYLMCKPYISKKKIIELNFELTPVTALTQHNGGGHRITWRGIIKCKSFTEMLFRVANAMVCLFSLPL